MKEKQERTSDTSENNDAKLIKKASLRAGFKIHTGIFILVNLLCWVVWLFVFRKTNDLTSKSTMNAVLFLSIAWFIILVAHFLIVYRWNRSMVDKELANLKKEMKAKEDELKHLKNEQKNKLKQDIDSASNK